MSNQLIPLNAANLPAAAQKRMAEGKGIADHLKEGVGSPMDILSLEGKRFTEKVGGEAVPGRINYEFDVVILEATSNLEKRYYKNPYVQGSMAPPDCWSLNAIKPDPQSADIQSTTCRGCRWNVFGSRIVTDRPGQPASKAKACADGRRVAVLPAYKLTPADGSDPGPQLLRIPATSLAPLKNYGIELERMGIPVNAVVTRLAFDPSVTHAQLTFMPMGMLSPDQFSHVEYLLRPDDNQPDKFGDERMRRILEAPPPGDDADASEFQGQQITNRNEAPPPTVTATAHQAPLAWTPKGETAMRALPSKEELAAVERAFSGQKPEPAVAPGATSADPDWEEFRKWKESQQAPAQPISERAKAAPPANPTPANAPAPGASQTGWKPATATPPAKPANAGWRPSQGNGPIIQGEAVEVKDEPKQEAAPAQQKKRRSAPPANDANVTAQEAPASLDALLSDLEFDKK